MPVKRISNGLESDSPFTWVVTDSTARGALTLDNIAPAERSYYQNRLCYQTTDSTIWELANYSTMAWVQVGGVQPDWNQSTSTSLDYIKNKPFLPEQVSIDFKDVKCVATTNQPLSVLQSDVYACVSTGDIYMQTGAVGTFNALSQTSRQWSGLAASPSGDIYACVVNDRVYKQTGGTGNFVQYQTNLAGWSGICVSRTGDIYACGGIGVYNGTIYKQTGGVGSFTQLSVANLNYSGICSAPNGDVYVCVTTGDIYKQTGGAGAFNALSQTTRAWIGICAAPNGDIYATALSDGIFKQTGGTGNFVLVSNIITRDVAAAPNGDIYACGDNGDIYKQTGGVGVFNALSQTSRNWQAMTVKLNMYFVDGYLLQDNEYILLTGQTNSSENGIYVFSLTDRSLTRAAGANTAGEINGISALVANGTVNANRLYKITNTVSSLGVDPIIFKYVRDKQDADWLLKMEAAITGVSAPTTATVGRLGDVRIDTNLNYWTLRYIEGSLYYWSPDGFPAYATAYFSHFDKARNVKIFKVACSPVQLSATTTLVTITTAHGMTMAGIEKFAWWWQVPSGTYTTQDGNRYGATTSYIYASINTTNTVISQYWTGIQTYSAYFQIWFW